MAVMPLQSQWSTWIHTRHLSSMSLIISLKLSMDLAIPRLSRNSVCTSNLHTSHKVTHKTITQINYWRLNLGTVFLVLRQSDSRLNSAIHHQAEHEETILQIYWQVVISSVTVHVVPRIVQLAADPIRTRGLFSIFVQMANYSSRLLSVTSE